MNTQHIIAKEAWHFSFVPIDKLFGCLYITFYHLKGPLLISHCIHALLLVDELRGDGLWTYKLYLLLDLSIYTMAIFCDYKNQNVVKKFCMQK